MIEASVRSEGRECNYEDVKAFVNSLRGRDDAIILVAYSGYQLAAGVIVAFFDKTGAEPAFEVRHLYVDPKYRGQGVAETLMQGLLHWAVCGDAPVFITTEGEPRPYYLALGFEPTHRICVSSLSKLRERLRG